MHQADIKRITHKLLRLRSLDPELVLFGAEFHGYHLYPPLEGALVTVFERLHNVSLPADYRSFVQRLGDGGAGPYYGLCALGMSLYLDMDYPQEMELLVPGRPFPLTNAYVPENEADRALGYHGYHLQQGMVHLCNYGCGVFVNLVVTGPSAGTVWTDARSIQGGLYPGDPSYPGRYISFLEWYEHWMDSSLIQLEEQLLYRSP